jgi:hypothetical protein
LDLDEDEEEEKGPLTEAAENPEEISLDMDEGDDEDKEVDEALGAGSERSASGVGAPEDGSVYPQVCTLGSGAVPEYMASDDAAGRGTGAGGLRMTSDRQAEEQMHPALAAIMVQPSDCSSTI